VNEIRWEKHPLPIVSLILVSTIIIFYIDINTPLGFMVGILYFIPVFLTVYIRAKYAPFLVTVVSIVLIAIGFLFTPRDVPEAFALANRVFFSIMLIVSAVFIRLFTRNVENLRINEERYRNLTEWAPDAIVVLNENGVVYCNPSAVRLLVLEGADSLQGKDLIDLVAEEDRERMQMRVHQSMIGARIEALQVHLVRPDGSVFLAEASLGKIVWDETPGVQVILRDITDREVPCKPESPKKS
jgi:PAS domain S-box-containing protein